MAVGCGNDGPTDVLILVCGLLADRMYLPADSDSLGGSAAPTMQPIRTPSF